jgi:hypothetical protein
MDRMRGEFTSVGQGRNTTGAWVGVAAVLWLLTAALAAPAQTQTTRQVAGAVPTRTAATQESLNFMCPSKLRVGILAVPEGWATFSGELLQFVSASVIPNSDGTTAIFCAYGKNGVETNYQLTRQVPAGYVCRLATGATSGHEKGVNCTKKPAIKPPLKVPGRFLPPAIAVTDVRPAPSDQGGSGRTRYSIEVTNWQNYPVDFYQSTKNVLPTHPCGADARGVVTTWLAQEGKPPSKKGCKGVSFVEDLRTLGVTVAGTLADTDKVYVTLEDRLTGEKYESGAYMVGWYGVGKLLFPVGCKHFLGRAGQFLCSTEQGMASCENLKKQGKPIQCTRQGQPAK